MRDKIVFFVLGAVLATIAYTIGDLETLTAETENKVVELDHLYVNRITVKEGIMIGDVGTRPILITSTNESAEIILSGGKVSNDAIRRIDYRPTISLVANNDIASVTTVSHSSERPEASSTLCVINKKGTKFESALMLQDSNGKKVTLSNSTD